MKYIFRLISLVFAFSTPIILINKSWDDKEYLVLIIWVIILISNILALKDIINLINDKIDREIIDNN